VSWLRNLIWRWLHTERGVRASAGSANPTLQMLASTEAAAAIFVVPIRNGFLLCRRSYNPNGPDPVEATYADTVEALATLLVADMAAQRLTK
jgi:hypothetical protein